VRGIAYLMIGANSPVVRFHEDRPLHRLFDRRSIEAAHDADLKPFKLADGAGAQLDFEVESLAGDSGPRGTYHQTIPRRRRKRRAHRRPIALEAHKRQSTEGMEVAPLWAGEPIEGEELWRDFAFQKAKSGTRVIDLERPVRKA
jgi:hypothetical protein